MAITIEIDYREKDCLEFTKDLAFEAHPANLPIGDFVIKNDHDIMFVIERKTRSDLSASIIDGRFREQKQRLIDSIGDPSKIIYIIEGSKKTKMDKTLDSAIINLMIVHKYFVITTKCPKDTMQKLEIICKKMGTIGGVVGTVKEKPKELLSKDHSLCAVFARQIACIPQIGMTIAEKIANEYQNINRLTDVLKNKESRIGLEEFINAQNTKRKMGKNTVEKLTNYIGVGASVGVGVGASSPNCEGTCASASKHKD